MAVNPKSDYETINNDPLLLSLWRRARKRFSDHLGGVGERDLTKKLPGTQNSVGFLIRHVAEVELNVCQEHAW